MTGAEVKAWRETRDISQGQLAKLLPMNLRTLQGWERTAKPNGTPPPFMRRALADLERELAAKSGSPAANLANALLSCPEGRGAQIVIRERQAGEPNPWTDEGAGEGFPPQGTTPAPREVLSEREWESGYDALINAPDADCPTCGAQPLQMHKAGCAGAPDEPVREPYYELDDEQPTEIAGEFEPRTHAGRRAAK